MGRTACAAAALLALASAGAAQAGVRIELRSAHAGAAASPASADRYVVWIDGPLLAAEPWREGGAPAQEKVVFRSREDVVWVVDAERRSYYQVDPESARAAASQVAGLREGIEQGLGALPPGQREAVTDLLGDLASPPAEFRPEYRLRARGETGRYAGRACARHDLLEGQRRVADVCLAEYGTPPLARARVAAVPALGAFLRRALIPLAREFPALRGAAPLSALGSVDGFPLAVRSAEGGAIRETAVTVIEEVPVDPALFELPGGFTRSYVPPFR